MRGLVPVDLGVESAALVGHAAAFCGHGEGEFVLFHVYDHKADAQAVSHDADWIDPHIERLCTELDYLRAQTGALPCPADPREPPDRQGVATA